MFDQDQRRAVYALRFAPYPGLLVHVRKPGYGALERLARAVTVLGDDLSGEGVPADRRVAAYGTLFRAFATALVGWTLADRGRPVPATLAGVMAQDPEFLRDMARTWYRVVVLAPVEQPQPAEDAPLPDEPEPDELDEEPGVDEEWLAQLPVQDMLPAPEEVPA